MRKNIKDIKNIGIVGHPEKYLIYDAIKKITKFLISKNYKVYLDKDLMQIDKKIIKDTNIVFLDKKELSDVCDIILSVGGDGTVLSIAREIVSKNIPLIGINRGSLGFLTQISAKNVVGQLDKILKGKYQLEEKITIEGKIYRNNKEIHDFLAINEIVCTRGGNAQMIQLEVFINNHFAFTQRSDGIIIATPTGSTAYSLAAGGSILESTLNVLTIVPVCPQSMNNRPIVIDGNSQVEILIVNDCAASAHFDGQESFDIHKMDKILIKPYHKKLIFYQPNDYQYFNTLRKKLHWGEQLV